MDSDKDLNTRISMLENELAKILGVTVKDFPTLLHGFNKCAAAASDRVVMSPEVPAVPGVRDLEHSGTEEDDAYRVCTNPGSEPASPNSAVAGNATVQVEGDEPVVRGPHTSVMQSGGKVARDKTAVPSSAAAAAAAVGGNVVILLSDSDSNDENMLSKKRDRRECGEVSGINCSRKRRRNNSTQPCGLPRCSHVEEGQRSHSNMVDLVESDEDSCSDSHMHNFVANLKK